ncbi:unnamed protein product [Enterobius vermicularis]|uniref:ATP-dependent RNA helicase DDX60 n=1 Tax=Enterobius vermicularis TaxID=51028 RepID=A0A0N4UWI1_ENTVE|nr:unnamed protein product [Enterobius vermicularis]
MDEDRSTFVVHEAYEKTFCEEDLQTLISFYCKFFAQKRAEHFIDKTVYTEFLSTALSYGFLSEAKKYYTEENEKHGFKIPFHKILGTCNNYSGQTENKDLFSALVQISKQQRSLGLAVWNREFVYAFDNISGQDSERMRIRRLWCVLRFRKVPRNNLPLCAGRLPFVKYVIRGASRKVQLQLNDSSRTNMIALSPYYASVFHTGFQRLMQDSGAHDLIVKSAVDFMFALAEGDYQQESCRTGQIRSGVQARNLGLFYAIEILIYCVAHSMVKEGKDLIQAVASLPALALEQQYTTLLRAYKALLNYVHWRQNNEMSQEELTSVYEDLEAAVNQVPSGEENVFLSALIHFLTSLNSPELLYDVAVKCCTRTPLLLGHCCHSLAAAGNEKVAEKLLEATSFPSNSSESDQIRLDWLQERLLHPQQHDLPENFILEASDLLCKFLDFGENRNDQRAWGFLWTCVKRISDRKFLSYLWDDRKSWWPKFHSIPISIDSARYREQVLDLFSKLSPV